MSVWYNENDPFAAAWLRELIAAGLIPAGDVDERSIAEVHADDLTGYVQCHFFAGIGGWPYALRLAGWDDTRPVWTGSCPCQPFSNAGKRGGFSDARHLWPVWLELIKERRPPIIFGEQVAGAADWLRLLRGDLEAVAYAVGCMPIEAASAGAPDYRDRYWFVAHDDLSVVQPEPPTGQQPGPQPDHLHGLGPLADCNGSRPSAQRDHVGEVRGLPEAECEPRHGATIPGRDGIDCGACALVARPGFGWGKGWTEDDFRQWANGAAAVASIGDSQIVLCPDGKWRPLPPPRVRWLGNGIPARVAKLRGFGNAIDPRPAAAFVKASMHAMMEVA